MKFHMRYTNVSDPSGYYQYDKEKVDAAIEANGWNASDVSKIRDYIAENPLNESKKLVGGKWSDLDFTDTTWGEFTGLDGFYM